MRKLVSFLIVLILSIANANEKHAIQLQVEEYLENYSSYTDSLKIVELDKSLALIDKNYYNMRLCKPTVKKVCYDLIKSLIINESFELVSYIEKHTKEREVKVLCWRGIKRYSSSSQKSVLLRKWAIENDTEISLLSYHPEALEKLFLVLEDPNGITDNRIGALYYIEHRYSLTSEDVNRLHRLEGDSTIIVSRSIEGPDKRLGTEISNAITRIKEKMKKQFQD